MGLENSLKTALVESTRAFMARTNCFGGRGTRRAESVIIIINTKNQRRLPCCGVC